MMREQFMETLSSIELTKDNEREDIAKSRPLAYLSLSWWSLMVLETPTN